MILRACWRRNSVGGSRVLAQTLRRIGLSLGEELSLPLALQPGAEQILSNERVLQLSISEKETALPQVDG